jgi:hypothetical protein
MEVFVHSSGNEQPELVEIEEVALIRSLIVESEPDSGIWLEEVDEEIDLDITIEVAGIRHHHHVHRGRCHRVKVTVRFNGVNHEHGFGPATTIKTVRTWACGPHAFKLSPVEAAKHVLALPGADHFLDDGVHNGSVATEGTCAVTLDLLPRSRFEG